MVWLNYRNAYERWDEQRRALNSEILEATQSVISQTTPLVMPSSSGVGGADGGSGGSTLFLQLTVNDIGVCIPLTPSYAVSNSNADNLKLNFHHRVPTNHNRIHILSMNLVACNTCFRDTYQQCRLLLF